ncbi:hypothetical protein GQ44DRAFT_828225 [Phaeosphaeriaceae sp. PMI808]|nr:hypothetical protein GQ44DRAFT_828225 [Phaeosphaeriaceae sp. PMI808]
MSSTFLLTLSSYFIVWSYLSTFVHTTFSSFASCAAFREIECTSDTTPMCIMCLRHTHLTNPKQPDGYLPVK